MRQLLGWVTVGVLCFATVAIPEQGTDLRLHEARAAFDEATKLRGAGRYADAIRHGEHALALRQAALGSAHPEVASALHLLGVLHILQGDFDRAEPLLVRGHALREAALGKDHPDVADSLNSLGGLYLERGAYARAEPLFERALAIWEKAPGGNHPKVAHALNNLAKLYWSQGLYGRAEPLYERALAIGEAAHGEHHPAVADLLDNLASLHKDRGLYGRAEPLHERALAIREAALGRDHPQVAASLNNLANLYKAQGLYGRAEPLYERARAMAEATLGASHPTVARFINNLAILYSEQGLYHQAERLYVRALTIQEAAQGRHHPDTAQLLHNLAALLTDQGQYTRAAPLHARALAIREAVLGDRHPLFAASLGNLAALLKAQGQYASASPLYERALAIEEAALGPNHPSIAARLDHLAQLRLAQGRFEEALPLFTRAFSLSEQRLRREALDFSEARLVGFLQHLRSDEERLYALLRTRASDARVRRLALSAALLRKGRSVEETADISRVVYRRLSAGERDAFERLRGLRTRLAALSLRGPLSEAGYQQHLEELAAQGDALEAHLARSSAPLRALAALPAPGEIIDRVAATLPKGGALVEFISYTDRPLVPRPGTPKSQLPSQSRYLAVVLFPDARIRAVDLGPAEPIDRAASSLRTALANRDASIQDPARALHGLVFRPLLPLLRNSRRLFLSPDGQLSLVPFAALHDGRQFLVETFDFTYLTSGKDLLPRLVEEAPSRSVVVLADPAFRASRPAAPASPLRPLAPAERSASLERFFSTSRADVAERPWVPLPGTREEARAIQRLMPHAQLFLGAEASKERLLGLSTPGVLHLATHGFFLEDAPVPTGARAVGHFGALGEADAVARPPDPLLRSGLVLAGAGAAGVDFPGAREPRPDDTLVTALELAGLNLWGTQLVVLSACDTGRGDVKLGQGVYGLRRAFVVAGAETVVMSLWKVNDETTRELMEGYYRHLLAGRGRAVALREAMRGLRATRTHPHHWAPFIALGQDAPLSASAPRPGAARESGGSSTVQPD
ncbi:CHAT domain-containing tetratricopeptide repeat protein [Pyxidicoccus xibeiensis]|uniref:CHAT domain-containing tetratricopeptide repeat protein n=1 Tax=Pyxidicoccus xibeiensis TaxID=2906759 RepID=UPI0020A7C247|nr:CHAT domain-containing protein [Pyxidicoccus xibeiensis]MCP3138191.1 CHAT domain-containing protein [Pyxidicoccus xibeiensis]